jgi:hypothetical protein
MLSFRSHEFTTLQVVNGSLNPALAVAIPPGIFRGVPGRILAPFLEVGFGAARQVVSPCRLERYSGLIKRRSSAVSLLAGIAPRIKAAMKLPLIT